MIKYFLMGFLILGMTLQLQASRRTTELSFGYYFSAQYYFFENVDDFFREMYKNSDKLTEEQKFEWLMNSYMQASSYLDSAVAVVINRIDQQHLNKIVREYRRWNKFYSHERNSEHNYVDTDHKVRAMAVDVQRYMALHSALYLALKDFRCFEDFMRFADQGKIRFPDGKRTMYCGEVSEPVKIKNVDVFYFMAYLLPDTFVKVQQGNIQWVCCVKTFNDPAVGNRSKFYFCTWDRNCEPVAVHKLQLPEGHERVENWELKVNGDQVNISALNCKDRKKLTFSFPIQGANRNCVEL